MRSRRLPLLSVTAALVVGLAGGCATSPRESHTQTRLTAVAAEDTWGDLVRQVGGDRVRVTSVISNPQADPHSYEPTAEDGRAVATADYVVGNGAGYDPWIDRLVDANPRSQRRVLTVSRLLGAASGANPHFWYSPSAVERVIAQIEADFIALDPAGADYYRGQHQRLTQGLSEYRRLVHEIRSLHAGTRIGATENIVAPLAAELGLALTTPPEFLNAVAEGGDPPVAAKAEADQEISSRSVKALLVNTQNRTPDVEAQVALARSVGLPVVDVTETLTPTTATFQDWQVQQLQRLQTALAGNE
jgi:zinc/manganese transport system substrate-binding protein